MDETLVLKALSHETRLGIVRLLLQRTMCVRARPGQGLEQRTETSRSGTLTGQNETHKEAFIS